MRPAPVVRVARERVSQFRQRLHRIGFSWYDDQPVDLETISELILGCPIIPLAGLNDRAAVRHLREAFSFAAADDGVDEEPLAGALYVSESGLPRWIFVESADRSQRRRFTIAHEIGHLVIEAEPKIAQRGSEGTGFMLQAEANTFVRFSRCLDSALALGESRGTSRVWSDEDLREIAANHFAAELLMPIEGVRRLISQLTGPAGIRSAHDVEGIVTALSRTYDVSLACARTHLLRDLKIVPPAQHPNADLFG